MSNFRNINRTFLAKIESAPGTDAAPVVGTDAIAVEDPTFNYGFEVDETNEVTGSLDRSARYTGGGNLTMELSAILKGASAGGQAPEVGPLLRASALSETLLASDVTDVVQGGSSTTSVVLASGEISANGLYVGAVIEFTDGDLDGERAVITGSVASSDTVTVFPAFSDSATSGDGYIIHACATYAPASVGLEVVTGYLYQHNAASGENHRLEKVLGAAATCQLNVPVRRVGRWRFGLTGQLTEPADVAAPGNAIYSADPQPVLKNAVAYIGGVVAKFSEFSIDFGNEVQTADDPTAAFGYDVAGITRRRISGRINPRTDLVASRNAFADISAGTTREILLMFGSGDGGTVAIYIPEARFVTSQDANNNGFAHEGLDFDAQGSDTGVYVTMF